MAIATLTIDLVAKLAGLQSSFDRAAQVVQSNAKRMDSAMSLVGASVKGFAAALAPAALLAGFKGLVSAIDDLDEAAQGLGTTAVELASFRRGAVDAGVGAEAFDAALTKLNVKLTDAATGNKEAAALFEALGVATKTAAGEVRASGDVLRDVADVFAKLPDGADKSRLAVELFGKAGAKMVPLLNQGADGLERFTGLSDDTVKAAAKLQQEFDKFGASVDEVKFKIAGGLLPAINDVIDIAKKLDFKRALDQGGMFFVLKDLGEQIGEAKKKQDQLNEALKLGVGAYSNEGRVVRGSAKDYLDRAKAIKEAGERAEEAQKKAAAFLETLQKRATTADLGEFQALRVEAAQLGVARAAEKYIAQLEKAKTLNEQIKGFIKEQEEAEKRRDEAQSFSRQLTDRIAALQLEADMIGKSELEQRKLTAAREIDAQVLERIRKLEDPAEIGRTFDEGEAAKRQAALRIEQSLVEGNAKALQDLLDEVNLETEAIGKSNAERQRAILLRELDKKGIKEGTEAYAQAVAKINEVTAAIANNEITQVVQQRIDGMAQSVAGLVGEFAKTGDIKSFFDNLTGYLLDLTTQILIVEPLAQTLRDALTSLNNSGSGGSAGGGLLGGLMSALGSSFGGARARGGPVSSGTPYLVGERGAEIFVPSSNGSIVPNSAMGGLAVHNTFVLPPGGMTRETQNQIAATAARSIASAQRRFN